MQSAIRSGNRDVSPMDFVDALKEDFGKSTLGYLKSLPADKILESIPEEILTKIRQADLARVKAMPQHPQQRRSEVVPMSSGKPEQLSPDQFRRRMLEKLR
jgi:hypothetical protein